MVGAGTANWELEYIVCDCTPIGIRIHVRCRDLIPLGRELAPTTTPAPGGEAPSTASAVGLEPSGLHRLLRPHCRRG